ncbi:MAG TPA: GNAT family N-acetyltransferase [Clostridia bacterium]|nr:GNAT family N-acetyltransferase [Clostridia bacterium]
MTLRFKPLSLADFTDFHRLMTEYYRTSEDADTPEDVIDAFIHRLFNGVLSGELHGCLAYCETIPAGFALFEKDNGRGDFTEIMNYGTILEIGLAPQFQAKGLGKALVAHVEKELLALNVEGLYVCAYGPAQRFWIACGYQNSKKPAANGLPIFIKAVEDGGTQ